MHASYSQRVLREMENMKRCLCIWMAAVVILGLFAGCAASSAKVYGEKDTAISAEEGQTFVVRLNENPTTGYQWTYAIGDESIVQFVKEDYQADSKDTQLAGSGGVKEVTFKALKKGQTTIAMVYERSWEKNPDDQKIVYNVEVK